MHEYINNENVPPIRCPDDETIMHVVDAHDEPALSCFTCDTVYIPGKNTLNNMKRNLDEFRN